MMLRPLRHGMVHSTNGFKTAISVDHKIAFSKLLQIYQNTPIAIIPFENYLTEVDNLVKSCYKPLSLPERSNTEKSMFLTANIPTLLMPAVTAMLTTKMDALMGQQDPGKIMGHDVVWLGLTDDKRTKQFLERQRVDIIRKLPLGKGAKMRRCTRCGSVMEDIQLQGGPQSNQQPWVWQSQKNCVCFASWASGEVK
jgi:mediator of RNA polymerase II transcription subunit 16